MWKVGEISVVPTYLNFFSSGGGEMQVRQLLFDQVRLANAVELTDWTRADRIQVVVCEDCGHESCEPGGWVSVRNVGVGVVLCPAFSALEDDEWDDAEFAPPACVLTRGTPFLTAALYARLRALVPGLPEMEALEPLSGREFSRIFQMDAPAEALGLFPKAVSLKDGLVLAVSEGELDDAKETLARRLGELQGPAVSVRFRAIRPDEVPVSFFMDTVPTREWPALTSAPMRTPSLLVDASTVVESV